MKIGEVPSLSLFQAFVEELCEKHLVFGNDRQKHRDNSSLSRDGGSRWVGSLMNQMVIRVGVFRTHQTSEILKT